MQKLFTASLMAAGLVTAAPAYAEFVSVATFGTFVDTASDDYWQVKYLGGPNTGDVSDESYNWEAARDQATYGGYEKAHLIDAGYARDVLHWNTDPDLYWISYNAEGRHENGYYSYKATFLDTVEIDLSQFSDPEVAFTGLSISFASDDHVHAIYINGDLYTRDFPQPMNYPGWEQQLTNILLTDITWYNDGENANTIEFIVHNNNSGSRYLNEVNPTGFAANVQAAYVVYNPIPEPETYAMMLAGLGIVGAIARRRRNRSE